MSTIAAVATGNVVSAIGIVRLSGEDSLAIADRVFCPLNRVPLSLHPRRTMVYGAVCRCGGHTIDRCMAAAFSADASFTGEDSVEFYCHGSPVVLQMVLQELFACGAVQAKGGEFTQRAFLNGKLDLTQAEAVIDLIEAETPQAAQNAVKQLEGILGRQIALLYDELLQISSQFYAVVDYPDEDIEELTRQQLAKTLADGADQLAELLDTVQRGQILRNGVATAIIGRPNVGKSSLLNALVGYERAIVTELAGTTRDTVEEKTVVGGTLLRLIDTAGLRETDDRVERLGVERARQAAQRAQLVVLTLDGSQPLSAEDRLAMEVAQLAPKQVVAVNKSDLPPAWELSEIPFAHVLRISAREGKGLRDLGEAIAALFPVGETGRLLTNARQVDAVRRAESAIRRGQAALDLTPDAVLTDVEEALSALGELTGRTVKEDMVARIFERFCVGK